MSVVDNVVTDKNLNVSVCTQNHGSHLQMAVYIMQSITRSIDFLDNLEKDIPNGNLCNH